MTVNLTRIYTKLGDGGETHLGDMSRVSKLHPRVEAYGTVDELNATIGVALLQPGLPEQFAEWLRRVQNDLLDVGADLSVPGAAMAALASDGRARARLRVGPEYTEWLEQACDEVNATLAPLRSFVIPGGTPAAAHLHVCRTVCRRAERRAIAVGEEGNPEVVRYLNRLSDLLFILSRAVNARAGRGRAARAAVGARARTAPAPAPRALLSCAREARGRPASAARRRAARRRRAPSTASRHQVAAEHVAGHVPGEDQQRRADGQPRTPRRARRRAGAGARARRARRTARARARPSSGRSARRPGRCSVVADAARAGGRAAA